jgi:hypothetical protein
LAGGTLVLPQPADAKTRVGKVKSKLNPQVDLSFRLTKDKNAELICSSHDFAKNDAMGAH